MKPLPDIDHSEPRSVLQRPVEVESSLAGVSVLWRKLLLQAEMAAPHLQVAAIEGEQGTGKHALARFIHSRSPLFGNGFERRDARQWLATDADSAKLSGLIYLDRVDLLAAPGQNLLLEVLKTQQDRPAGRAILLASSQTPLRPMVAQSLFSPDLAFRLTAVRFAIPPLRQRREDIPPLVQALLDRLCARYQHRPVTLGPGVMACLLQHSWPGNVRELASVLESALLECANGIIRCEELDLSRETETLATVSPVTQPEDLALDAVIRRHVQAVVDLNRGNKLRAARQLRISRSTLYRILANGAVPEGAGACQGPRRLPVPDGRTNPNSAALQRGPVQIAINSTGR